MALYLLAITAAGLALASTLWSGASAAPASARAVRCDCYRRASTHGAAHSSTSVRTRSDPGRASLTVRKEQTLNSRFRSHEVVAGAVRLDPATVETRRRWVETPARYETRTTRTLEQPAGWSWRRELTVDDRGRETETLCREWRAARYRTASERVMVAPAKGGWVEQRVRRRARAADPPPPPPECRRRVGAPTASAAARRTVRAQGPAQGPVAVRRGVWRVIRCPPHRTAGHAPTPGTAARLGRLKATAPAAPAAARPRLAPVRVSPPPKRTVAAVAAPAPARR